jgi:tripartite-type tricarboxylate transporter receptor subunit TctC
LPYQKTALFACMAAALAAAGAAAAQPYPSKPIRLVLSVGTGGVGDTSMRLFAEHMSRGMGQRVVVDNRPGGGGVVAATAVLNANRDGYTLLQSGNGGAIRAALFKSLPFDIQKDFQQVSTIAFFQLVLVARPDSGFGSVADVLDFARRNPRKLNIGTIAVGSTQYLAAELLKSTARIEAQVVPYKSNSLLIAALRSNELRVAFELIGPVLTHIKDGALRALAVGSDRRFAGLPDVPTMAEAGIGHYNVSSWTGIAAPLGTPAAVVNRLSREAMKVAGNSDVQRPLQEMGIEARGSTPAEATRLMAASVARWSSVIEQAKIPRQ